MSSDQKLCENLLRFFSFLLIQSSAVGPVSAVDGAKRTLRGIETSFFRKNRRWKIFLQTITSILTRQLCPIRVENFLLDSHRVIFFDAETTKMVFHWALRCDRFFRSKNRRKLFLVHLVEVATVGCNRGLRSKVEVFSENFSSRFSWDGWWWAEFKQLTHNFHHR